MKRFAVLVLLLSLGMFSVGCQKPAETKKSTDTTTTTTTTDTEKSTTDAGAKPADTTPK